jgi:hypothetical protein
MNKFYPVKVSTNRAYEAIESCRAKHGVELLDLFRRVDDPGPRIMMPVVYCRPEQLVLCCIGENIKTKTNFKTKLTHIH